MVKSWKSTRNCGGNSKPITAQITNAELSCVTKLSPSPLSLLAIVNTIIPHQRKMTTSLPLSYPSSSSSTQTTSSSNSSLPSHPPFSDPPKLSTTSSYRRPPDQIDLSQIEIVDLTEPSPSHASRRPRPS